MTIILTLRFRDFMSQRWYMALTSGGKSSQLNPELRCRPWVYEGENGIMDF